MKYLSQIVEQVADLYFVDESDWVKEELQGYCAYLSKFILDEDIESYDRFCLAVLKVGNRSKDKFMQAIELGKCDYRDLFVAAGFGNSVSKHKEWANNLVRNNT
ncbi:MAG: hypothetical protein P8163_17395 [Candidatus Thiodiazotropha sp.]